MSLLAPLALHGDYAALQDWYAAHGLLREPPPAARPALTLEQRAARSKAQHDRQQAALSLLRRPRDTQTAECCGYKYHRWRVRGAAKFPAGHTHCCRCGKPLAWSS